MALLPLVAPTATATVRPVLSFWKLDTPAAWVLLLLELRRVLPLLACSSSVEESSSKGKASLAWVNMAECFPGLSCGFFFQLGMRVVVLFSSRGFNSLLGLYAFYYILWSTSIVSIITGKRGSRCCAIADVYLVLMLAHPISYARS